MWHRLRLRISDESMMLRSNFCCLQSPGPREILVLERPNSSIRSQRKPLADHLHTSVDSVKKIPIFISQSDDLDWFHISIWRRISSVRKRGFRLIPPTAVVGSEVRTLRQFLTIEHQLVPASLRQQILYHQLQSQYCVKISWTWVCQVSERTINELLLPSILYKQQPSWNKVNKKLGPFPLIHHKWFLRTFRLFTITTFVFWQKGPTTN